MAIKELQQLLLIGAAPLAVGIEGPKQTREFIAAHQHGQTTGLQRLQLSCQGFPRVVLQLQVNGYGRGRALTGLAAAALLPPVLLGAAVIARLITAQLRGGLHHQQPLQWCLLLAAAGNGADVEIGRHHIAGDRVTADGGAELGETGDAGQPRHRHGGVAVGELGSEAGQGERQLRREQLLEGDRLLAAALAVLQQGPTGFLEHLRELGLLLQRLEQGAQALGHQLGAGRQFINQQLQIDLGQVVSKRLLQPLTTFVAAEHPGGRRA